MGSKVSKVGKGDTPPTAFSGSPGAALLSEEAWSEIGEALKLSPRELQIARGIFDDATEFAMALDLEVSVHTVHTHGQRLFRKLKVRSRPEMILRIIAEFLALTASSEGCLRPH